MIKASFFNNTSITKVTKQHASPAAFCALLIVAGFSAACGPMAKSLPKTLSGQGSTSHSNDYSSGSVTLVGTSNTNLSNPYDERESVVSVSTRVYSIRPISNGVESTGSRTASPFTRFFQTENIERISPHLRLEISRPRELSQLRRSLTNPAAAFLISNRDFLRPSSASHGPIAQSEQSTTQQNPEVVVVLGVDIPESAIPTEDSWPRARIEPTDPGSEIIRIYFDLPENNNLESAQSLLQATSRIYIYRTR